MPRPCTHEAFEMTMNALPSAVKAMLHTGPSWFWMTDENHCLTGLSNRLYALSGEKPEDYLGKSRMDFIAGIAAYTPGGHAHRKQLEAREPFRDFTYQHSFTKLKLTWISASGDPVFDDDGVFCGYQGTAVAISPALEHASTSLSAERALLAQKIELQSKVDAHTAALDKTDGMLSGVLESMTQGVMVYDVTPTGQLDIVLMNRQFRALLDLPDELACPGTTVSDVMAHCAFRGDFDSIPGGRAAMRQAALAERPVTVHLAKTGRTVVYHTARRSATGAVVTLTDITAMENRKNALEAAERESQEANRLLTEVVDAMGEGLLVLNGDRLTDGDNQVLMVNPAYRQLFDLDAKDVVPGMWMRDFVGMLVSRGATVEKERFAEVERKLDAGEQVLLEIPSSGRSYYVKGTKRPSGGFVLVHTDVTDLQQRNDLQQEAREVADQASQAKSDFLAAMSHEIRTPMNGIIGMAELLSESPLNSKQAMFVRTILESGAALSEVIGDVLDFSKIEAGKMVLAELPVDLPSLARDVRLLLAHRADQAGIDLRIETTPDLAAIWMGDATRLRQILINLMGNAVKFTHQGHVTLRVGHGPNRQGVVLEVVDTGIGIPEDRLQTIFEAFEQANATSTDEYGGTGLGLEISRRLVGLMGGELSARSTVGVGSVFRAVLPLVPALDDAIEPEILNYDTVDVTRRHIMIAEDNRTNQLVLRHMLTPLGAELTFCKDGIEVVDHFAQTGADVVLMDLSMPRRDGITATKVIRQFEKESSLSQTPIIALTGNSTAQDRDNCLSAGMNGFLTKPLRKAALLAEIGRLLPEIDCSPTSAKAS